MPKVLQCANCKKYLLGGTYTLIKHFEKCITQQPNPKLAITVKGENKKKITILKIKN
tara:strand:+ start:1747 stop:1917 length:171 start_codon:yes stop_codon:yes gene_type:complete